jgi:hypothetical protein
MDRDSSTVHSAGTTTVLTAERVTIAVDGLDSDTTYDVFFVTEASSSNGVFEAVQALTSITTHAEAPSLTLPGGAQVRRSKNNI